MRQMSFDFFSFLAVRITRDVSCQAIPRLTTMFTGREDILERLARWLDPSKPSMVLKMQRIFVLYGLGGAGKTQIMAKFVIECGDKCDNFSRT
jgi:predicted AAA+ superfamily ATPase